MIDNPRTFEEWWEHRPFITLIRSDCAMAWHARDSEIAELKAERDILRNSVESYIRIASGNADEITAIQARIDATRERIKMFCDKYPGIDGINWLEEELLGDLAATPERKQ